MQLFSNAKKLPDFSHLSKYLSTVKTLHFIDDTIKKELTRPILTIPSLSYP